MKNFFSEKQTAFKSIIVLMLVMFTSLSAKADATAKAEKVTPFVFLSHYGYGNTDATPKEPATYLNDMKFIEPSVIVYEGEQNRAMITNRFYISYYLTSDSKDGEKGVEQTVKGKTYSVDPKTGTRIDTRYGEVETGSTAGTVYVHVVATPSDRYTNMFNETENCYRITLKKVQADKPERITPEFLTNETYKNNWYAATGSLISLPNFHINYTTQDNNGQPLTLDVTKRFNVTATVDPSSAALAEVISDYQYLSLADGTTSMTAPAIKTNTTAGTAKIRFSFTPINKESYEAISDVEYELNIVDEKVSPKLVFPQSDELVYTGMQNIPVQRPTVYDQFGNDITPIVSYKDNTKPLWIAWSAAPLEEGKTMHTPQDYQTVTMKEYGYQPLPDNMLRFGGGVTTTWAPDINAGDLVFQKGVRRNEFVECNDAWYDEAKKTMKLATFTNKIYCQVYPASYNDEAKAKYNAAEEAYNLTVKPRPVKIQLSPNPTGIKVTKDMPMNFQNRFEVTGTHTCEIDDTKFGRKKGETFTLRHNSETFEFGCEYTVKFKTGEAKIDNYPYEDADHHITVDKDGNKVDPATYEGDTWEIYWSTKGHGTDNNWTLSFLKEGPVTLTYSLYPYNIGYYEEGSGNATINEEFNVEDKVTPIVKVTPNPMILYTSDEVFPAQPLISITDELGNDISSHYDLVFDNDALEKAGVKVDENGKFVIISGGPFKGDWSDLNVTAVPKSNDPENGKYKEGSTTFRIIVKEIGESTRFAWNVYNENGTSIGTGNAEDIKADDKKHGKLVFTAAGLVSGGYTIDAIPGLTITLGNLAKQDDMVAADGTTTPADATEEDPWIAADPGEVDGNKVVVYGAPVEVKEDGIPTDGTYYILMPRTNGFLTIDAKFKGNNTIVLTDEAGKEKQTVLMTKDEKKEMQFRYPIYANTKYYLYNAGDATSYEPLKIHGFSFEPAFINQRNDMKSVENATAYANGFSGSLPSLTNSKFAVDDYVAYNITGNLADASEDISDYAEVDKTFGVVTTKTKGTATKFKEGNVTIKDYKQTLPLKEHHLKVYAEVKSAYANGGDKVKKVPAYNLYIGDIPTYVMQNGYTPNILERISTTNYPTHIRAFFGGWENDTDKPYFKNNKFEGENLEMLVDSWKTSKMDSVGSNERVIDNFAFASFGTQNASSETVNTKFVYDKDNEDQTYNVPCRGTYVQFEPNESGTVAVYIIQNGMVAYDGDPEHASKSGNNKVKINPVFIIDETGTPVKLTPWTHSVEGSGTEAYTEAVVRCDYADLLKYCTKDGKESELTFEANTKELLTKVGYISDMPGITKGTQQKVYDVAKVLDENAVAGSLGYSVITKAYTRYSFKVKAGKSYFLFMNGSKLGNDGFAFMPDEWTAGRTDKVLDTVVLDEKGSAQGSKDEFIGKEESFDKYDKTVNVKLYHSFKADQWTALSLPFSVNDTQIRKVFGDDAWVISLDQIADKATVDGVDYSNVAQFWQHNYHWIVAGRPYFIRPGKNFKPTLDESDGRQYVALDSVTFERASYATDDVTGTGFIQAKTLTNKKEVFNFKANYEPVTITTGDYFIGSTAGGEAKLYRATKDTPLGGYRAFIYNTDKASDARISSFGFGEIDPESGSNTTGINDVYEFYGEGTGKKTANKNGVFSVDGSKVADSVADIDKLPAGVYIMNGHTIVK